MLKASVAKPDGQRQLLKDISFLLPSYHEVSSSHQQLSICSKSMQWMEPSETMSENELFPFPLISSGILSW